MQKIRRDDKVVVIAGRDKGKRGQILDILKDGRLLVSGVNIVKKHTKPNPQVGDAGGILEKEAPIAASNVSIYNPTTDKADKVGIRVSEDGKKVRFFRSNNELIDAQG